MKKIFILCLVLTSCVGGGGSGASGTDGSTLDLTCNSDKPLLCRQVAGCCERGLPHYCDGFCFGTPQRNCVDEDTCSFSAISQIDKSVENLEGSSEAGIATEY